MAPTLRAQSVTVCVFQVQKGHKMSDDSDARGVVSALSTLKLPNGDAIKAIPVDGVSVHDEEAETQKRGCGFVAEVWRNTVPASTPMVAAAGANPSVQGPASYPGAATAATTVMVYSLRKSDSNKSITRGEADKSDPWTEVADTMARKIAGAR
jgi:hypothetical protein